MEGLTTGRIVHYVNHDNSHTAAIITWVNDELIDLVVFPVRLVNAVQSVQAVPYDEKCRIHTWHWIEHV